MLMRVLMKLSSQALRPMERSPKQLRISIFISLSRVLLCMSLTNFSKTGDNLPCIALPSSQRAISAMQWRAALNTNFCSTHSSPCVTTAQYFSSWSCRNSLLKAMERALIMLIPSCSIPFTRRCRSIRSQMRCFRSYWMENLERERRQVWMTVMICPSMIPLSARLALAESLYSPIRWVVSMTTTFFLPVAMSTFIMTVMIFQLDSLQLFFVRLFVNMPTICCRMPSGSADITQGWSLRESVMFVSTVRLSTWISQSLLTDRFSRCRKKLQTSLQLRKTSGKVQERKTNPLSVLRKTREEGSAMSRTRWGKPLVKHPLMYSLSDEEQRLLKMSALACLSPALVLPSTLETPFVTFSTTSLPQQPTIVPSAFTATFRSSGLSRSALSKISMACMTSGNSTSCSSPRQFLNPPLCSPARWA